VNQIRIMWERIIDLPTPYTAGGREYRVTVEGTARDDGTWVGRIVFRDGKTSRTTEQETSQPDRGAVEYWATGLEPVYLDGAFTRAK
jgi:hypothetical protein